MAPETQRSINPLSLIRDEFQIPISPKDLIVNPHDETKLRKLAETMLRAAGY